MMTDLEREREGAGRRGSDASTPGLHVRTRPAHTPANAHIRFPLAVVSETTDV